jgi:hypothetical protein
MSILNALALDTKRVTNEGLKRLNLAVAALYLLQAVAIILLADSAKGFNAITTSFLTKDFAATDIAGYPVLSSAARHLFDLNLAYVLAAALLAGAAAHILVATRKRKAYEADLRRAVNGARWTEYLLSFGLVFLAVALSAGVADLSLLFLILASISVFCFSAKAAEAGEGALDKGSRRFGLIAGASALIAVLIHVWSSYIYGTSLSIYAYLALVVLAVYLGTLYNLGFSGPRTAGKNYMRKERFYILSGLLAKTAIAWALFAAVLR